MTALLKIKLKKQINIISLNGITYHPTGNKFYVTEKTRNIYKWIEAEEIKSIKIIKPYKK